MNGMKRTQQPAAAALLCDEPASAAREWPGVASSAGRAERKGHPSATEGLTPAAELAYQEFCARRNAGEAVDLDEFCARFPEIRSLRRQFLEADRFVRAIEDLIPPGGEKLPYVLPGEQLGGYTIIRELGRGAFGQVYLATDENTGDRPVVLKLTFDDINEARMLGRLSHANIVPVLSAGRHSTGISIVCMPYLGNATLRHVLARAFPTNGSPPPRHARVILDAVRAAAQPDDPVVELGAPPATLHHGTWVAAVAQIGEQLATALAFVHQHGIYHRDLKPSNILLDAAARPLLLDFNLSKDERLGQSRVGGTLPYMAAEQLRALLRGDEDNEQPDGRADLFALGVILYELLTGQHPFGKIPLRLTEEETALLLLKRQQAGCTPVRRFNTRVDRGLATLIESCLAFEAKDRPASAAALVAALQRRSAPSRRMRALVCLVGALFLAMSGGMLAAFAPAPRNAETEYQRGCAAYDAGDYKKADGHLARALEADSDNVSYLFARGRSRLALGDAKGAAGYLDDALTRQPNNPQIFAALAHSELLAGRPAWAVKRFDEAKAVGFTPTVAFYHDRAYARLQAGLKKNEDFAAVQADLKEVFSQNPDCLPARYTRLLFALQKYSFENGWTTKGVVLLPEALEDANCLIKEYGQYAEVHHWAGQVYAALADGPDSANAKEGIDQWRKAVSLGWSRGNLERADLILARLGKDDCKKALKEIAAPKGKSLVLIPPASLFSDPGVQWLDK